MTIGEYVTAAGLKIKATQDILDEMSVDLRAAIDPLLNTDPDSPMGQIMGPFASQVREVWEIANIAFGGLDPDATEGVLLENVSAITGTEREEPFPSSFQGTHKLTVTLALNTPLPIGTQFSQDGDPTIQFVTDEALTSTTAGPYQVSAHCTQNGPIRCNANTLIVIDTPVVGLSAVNNTFDAELGSLGDDDPELRTRRESELRATGAANSDAIRADILAITVDGVKKVLACTVLFNDEDVYDVNGLPPHSIEALVFDGVSVDVSNDVIAQTIWDSKAGGIQSVGTTFGTAVDKTGAKQNVRFSRPAVKNIAFQVTISSDPDTYAGDAAVNAAILSTFATKQVNMGSVIVCAQYVAAVMPLTGILDVPGVQITINGQSFPGIGVNFHLAVREIGTSQAAWITIVQV